MFTPLIRKGVPSTEDAAQYAIVIAPSALGHQTCTEEQFSLLVETMEANAAKGFEDFEAVKEENVSIGLKGVKTLSFSKSPRWYELRFETTVQSLLLGKSIRTRMYFVTGMVHIQNHVFMFTAGLPNATDEEKDGLNKLIHSWLGDLCEANNNGVSSKDAKQKPVASATDDIPSNLWKVMTFVGKNERLGVSMASITRSFQIPASGGKILVISFGVNRLMTETAPVEDFKKFLPIGMRFVSSITFLDKKQLNNEKSIEAKVTDKVFTVGFPVPSLMGQEAKYTEGVVSALSGIGGDRNFIQTTTPIQSGNSGGPLMNEQGQVVGVIQSKIGSDSLVSTTDEQTQNVNYAVKIENLRILADKVGVVPGALGVTTNATRHDVFNRVRAATVLLQAR